MARLPDLTTQTKTSLDAPPHCPSMQVLTGTRPFQYLWDLTLHCDLEPHEPMPALPGPFRSIRALVLAARADGAPIKPFALELNLEARCTVWAIGYDALGGATQVDQVAVDCPALLREIKITVTPKRVRLAYKLRIIGDRALAEGMLALLGSDLQVEIEPLDGEAVGQVHLFEADDDDEPWTPPEAEA